CGGNISTDEGATAAANTSLRISDGHTAGDIGANEVALNYTVGSLQDNAVSGVSRDKVARVRRHATNHIIMAQNENDPRCAIRQRCRPGGIGANEISFDYAVASRKAATNIDRITLKLVNHQAADTTLVRVDSEAAAARWRDCATELDQYD